MNAQEFKAWFTGFTEGKELLTKEQLVMVRSEVERLSAGGALPFPSYPQYPGAPHFCPSPIVTQTRARVTVSDRIAWQACDPIPLPLIGITAYSRQ